MSHPFLIINLAAIPPACLESGPVKRQDTVANALHTNTSLTDSATALTPDEAAYVIAVFREVARIAARAHSSFDADDIASDVALGTAQRASVIMNTYPDPASYARQRARHAGISFDRRERAQRGEGTRLCIGRDGLLHPGRQYVSADAEAAGGGSGPVNLAIDDAPLLEITVTDHMVDVAMLQRCCDGLPTSEVREVWLIDGCGYTVKEIAASCGQRRETVSRRLSRARRRIRQNRAAMSSSTGYESTR